MALSKVGSTVFLGMGKRRREELLRVAYINKNALKEQCRRGKLGVLGIEEHT